MTKIEWTDETWNPLRATFLGAHSGWHCERVSPGCQNCYAERLNHDRFGTGLKYVRSSRDVLDIYLDEAALAKPLHWRKPRKVFVCSMTDLFGEWVPDEWIDRVFAVMALSPQHTFQVLTKRPERMRAYLSGEWTGFRQREAMADISGAAIVEATYPIPNVWLGTSVEDQKRADERIPELLACPAAVWFISLEPMLGPVDLENVDYRAYLKGLSPTFVPDSPYAPMLIYDVLRGHMKGPDDMGLDRLDWVIIGGESGPGARPCAVGWIRSVVAQCQAAAVPVFVKQLGSKPVSLDEVDDDLPRTGPANTVLKLGSRKGGGMGEWPEDLRVREWPL